MSVSFEMGDRVAVVTGAAGALGSAVCEAFSEAGATTIGADVIARDDEESMLHEATVAGFHQGDFTDPDTVEQAMDSIAHTHGRIDVLVNIAGTWMGGDHIEDTDVGTFDAMMDINLKTMFLASKYAIPYLQESNGAIVSVSARSSLEGGTGDGPYRASKAGVRLLTETIAEENIGTLRANAIMPSVIDTPMNRDMMPDADHDRWVDPSDIAAVILWLCSDGASVTSGAAVPVYGES